MKKSIFGTELLILLLILVNCASATPVLYSGNENYYEKVDVSGGITWDNANNIASNSYYNSIRGHLVTVTSQDEQSFLDTTYGSLDGYWAGGYQLPGSSETDGGWVWVTGQPMPMRGGSEYQNWVGTDPNNIGGNENVLIFWAANQWGDYDQNALAHGYVVEYDAANTSIPEFPSVAIPVAAILGLVVVFGHRKNMV